MRDEETRLRCRIALARFWMRCAQREMALAMERKDYACYGRLRAREAYLAEIWEASIWALGDYQARQTSSWESGLRVGERVGK